MQFGNIERPRLAARIVAALDNVYLFRTAGRRIRRVFAPTGRGAGGGLCTLDKTGELAETSYLESSWYFYF